MAITYPLSHPATGLRSVRILPRRLAAVSESEFTLAQQAQLHQGARFEFRCELAPQDRDNGEEWAAFLLELDGVYGTFLLGDPSFLAKGARGALGGIPLVNGGSQTGKNLNIDGLTPSVTNWIRKGDYFQLGTGAASRLYKCSQSANSNGSGQATLQFWPPIVTAPTDNATVTVTGAMGEFRLAAQVEYSIDEALHFGFAFDAVAVVP